MMTPITMLTRPEIRNDLSSISSIRSKIPRILTGLKNGKIPSMTSISATAINSSCHITIILFHKKAERFAVSPTDRSPGLLCAAQFITARHDFPYFLPFGSPKYLKKSESGCNKITSLLLLKEFL